MHFLHIPTTVLLVLAALTQYTIAKPFPGQSLAEIERRWSAGETEVSFYTSSSSMRNGSDGEKSLHCRPNAPGCYLYAWFHSLATFCRGDSDGQSASIHSGLTHRDATPAWPIQRENDAAPSLYDGGAFSYATDERTMLRAQRVRRADSAPLLQKMKNFVTDFYRQRGEKGVIARDAQMVDSAPVLKPRRGMRYAFTA